MLYPNKKYKKGQLVTIDSKVYRIVDLGTDMCNTCPLRSSLCFSILGLNCVKEVH